MISISPWCWPHLLPPTNSESCAGFSTPMTPLMDKRMPDDVANSKPDPEVFVTAMKSASIDPRRALAIGDSVWDIRAARAAGIACITVETGGFSQHELDEEGSARVYRDVSELLSQLFTSPIASLLTT
jgi:phosphoglycolate phosphatase-like HAD superfamily hydrolase